VPPQAYGPFIMAASSVSALTAAGAGYLVWLGAVTACRPATVEAAADAPARSARGTLLAGAGTSGLNPKVLVLFLALPPQFTDKGGALSLPLQIGVLGATHVLNCAVVYTAVAMLARTILRNRPGIARGVSRTSGLAMMAIGVALFVERLHS